MRYNLTNRRPIPQGRRGNREFVVSTNQVAL
jgi:hypothetical protein